MLSFRSFVTALFITTVAASYGQAPSLQTAEEKKTDSVILATIITPSVKAAAENEQLPDWKALTARIASQYDATYADRTVTKAKIYNEYGRDWPGFCAALVHYTEAYENKDDAKLMDKNAKMILEHSDQMAERKAALTWAKHAVDKQPANAAYQETYKALLSKTN